MSRSLGTPHLQSQPPLPAAPIAVIARPMRTEVIRRAAVLWCVQRGWAPLAEFALPDGRRADVMALAGDGSLVVIEVKSCAEDFRADHKWQDYAAWCDRFYFAVDAAFPEHLLPGDAGALVVAEGDSAELREAAVHPLAAARRRSLLLRFAQAAALRATRAADPVGMQALNSALRAE